MATEEELNNQDQLNEKLKEQLGINEDIFELNQNIGNDILLQIKGLKDQAQTRKDIRKFTSEANKLAKEALNINAKDLGTQKNLAKIATQQESASKNINNLLLQKAALEGKTGRAAELVRQALEDQIEGQEKVQAVLEKQEETSRNIANNLGVQIAEGISDIISSVPGLRKFSGPFKEAADQARLVAIQGKGSAKAFGTFLGSLSKTAAIGLGLLALNTLIKTFTSLDSQSGEVAKNLGISYEESLGLATELSQAADFTDSLFINSKNLLNAQVQISQVLGTNVKLNQELLKSQVELNKQAGYSVETATLLSTISLATGNTTEDITNNFLGQTVALNAQNKVQLNSKQALEGISKISKGTLATFASQPKELSKAVFQARVLGLELSTLEGISDSLLDIESSIANEFEAEVITGRQLNLERARFFALNNDIAGVGKEIANQGITLQSFTESTRIEQDALAKAVGLTRDQLGESLILQEGLAAAGADDAEAAREKFEKLKAIGGEQYAINELGKTEYARQLASVSAQEKFIEVTNKLRDAFVSIAAPLLSIITPVIDILAPALTGISTVIGYIGEGLKTFKPIIAAAAIGAAGFATSLGIAAVAAGGIAAFLNPIGIGIAAAALLGIVGFLKSQKVLDGIAPASKGPFTITDSFGATAITAKGDGLAVSPNITREDRNTSGTIVLSDQQIQKIANAVREGASRATINLDGNRVSSRLQTPMVLNNLPPV